MKKKEKRFKYSNQNDASRLVFQFRLTILFDFCLEAGGDFLVGNTFVNASSGI